MTRTILQLPVRPDAGSVNPARLLLRTAGTARPFYPHSRETWERLVGGPSGGRALPFLVGKRARDAGKRAYSRNKM